MRKKIGQTMPHKRGSRGRNNARKTLTRHPLLMVVLGALAVVLAWLVSTTSLPFALAPTNPNLALKLNPSNPQALLTKADQARSRLLERVTQEITAQQEGQDTQTQRSGNSGAIKAGSKENQQSTKLSDEQSAMERGELRDQIRLLAKRIIAIDPLNARAYRLAAEVSDNPAQIKALMQQAARRSRRESVAQFWLLNDAYSVKNFTAALSHADILLRTRPQLAKFVMSYLLQIVDDPKGWPLVTKMLASNPKWRVAFLKALARNFRRPDDPLKLLIALKNSSTPLTAIELAPFLQSLIANGQVEVAYNLWLQFLPQKELTRLGLVYNSNFERDLSGLPFDWRIKEPLNAIVELSQQAQGGTGMQALHALMGPGRVQRLEAKQTIILVAGRYEVTVQVRGKLRAKRGLRWRMQCRYGKRQTIGQSEMIIGVMPRWQSVKFIVTIPVGPPCRAQTISLIHDSRSASEDFISGDVWFDNLKISRAAN